MRSRTIRILLPPVVLLCAFTGVALGVTITYAAINVPGAAQTHANGINGSNVIVGSFTDASGHVHGFRLQNGRFTTIDFPASTSTSVQGINDRTDVVGIYTASGSPLGHGFFLHHGVFTKIDFPGAQGTIAMGINNARTIVGGFNNSHGFIWSKGVFKQFDAPTNGSPDTILNGISNTGVIAGQVFSGDHWRGFIKTGGDLDFLAALGALDNEAEGVNTGQDVIGCHDTASGFLALKVEASEGTEKTERFPPQTAIMFPGSTNTCSMAINNHRAIVGTYLDKQMRAHGFLALAR